MIDEEDFLKRVLSMVRTSIGPSVAENQIPPCEQYSESDYADFIEQRMVSEVVLQFKEHCKDCLSCQKGLGKAQAELGQREDELLYEKTMNLLDNMRGAGREEADLSDVLPFSNVIRIAVEFYKGFLKIVETTGEILASVPVPVVRGEGVDSTEGRSVQILEEFESPPISLQISLKKEENLDEIDVGISVFDKTADDFVANLTVALKGPGISMAMSTDKHGEVRFSLREGGEYSLDILDDDALLTQLMLSIGRS